MAEIIITDEGHRGTVNFGLNGRIASKPVMVPFEADSTVTDALDAAGIEWESTAIVGEATGRHSISPGGKAGAAGNTYPLQVNGRLRQLEVGVPLDLTADELSSLTDAGIAYTAEYVESEEPEIDFDLEYSPDPGFDNAGAWTLKLRCAVSGSALNFTGLASPTCLGPAAALIEEGYYRATGTIDTADELHVARIVDFGGGGVELGNTVGPFSIDFHVPATSQDVRFNADSSAVMTLGSCSIKRTNFNYVPPEMLLLSA